MIDNLIRVIDGPRSFYAGKRNKIQIKYSQILKDTFRSRSRELYWILSCGEQ